MNIQSLKINEKEIKYSIKRSKKARRINLKINNRGDIELVIPYFCSKREGIEFVNSKRNWIEKHLPRIERKYDGFYFFGEKIQVEKSENIKGNKYYYSDEERILHVPVNGSGDNDYFLNWIRREARNYIPERTKEIAEENGFTIGRISIRNQRTRWGSCTSSGNLSFNMRLMTYPPEIIDYVIVHELCHLKEMNHSAKFWKHVEKIMPEYKHYRKQLKSCAL